jgi:formamidopyrimidine-DNA glycosylase
MPELPEVETNAQNLARWAEGRRITAVTPPPGTRETLGTAPRTFVSRLRGRKIERVSRRGKWILVELDGDAALGLHLGMTGHILRVRKGKPLPRFARGVFALDDGNRVVFADSRRFGRLVPISKQALHDLVADLGPDALGVTPKMLAEALVRTARTVKETIMDQRVLAGIGNLYAAEALWRAKIHPARGARAIARNPAQVRKLAAAIRAALRHGLRTYAGEEEPSYIEEGGPNPFYCYGREGEPCKRCETTIRAMTLGGRTSFYCPRCQK